MPAQQKHHWPEMLDAYKMRKAGAVTNSDGTESNKYNAVCCNFSFTIGAAKVEGSAEFRNIFATRAGPHLAKGCKYDIEVAVPLELQPLAPYLVCSFVVDPRLASAAAIIQQRHRDGGTRESVRREDGRRHMITVRRATMRLGLKRGFRALRCASRRASIRSIATRRVRAALVGAYTTWAASAALTRHSRHLAARGSSHRVRTTLAGAYTMWAASVARTRRTRRLAAAGSSLRAAAVRRVLAVAVSGWAASAARTRRLATLTRTLRSAAVRRVLAGTFSAWATAAVDAMWARTPVPGNPVLPLGHAVGGAPGPGSPDSRNLRGAHDYDALSNHSGTTPRHPHSGSTPRQAARNVANRQHEQGGLVVVGRQLHNGRPRGRRMRGRRRPRGRRPRGRRRRGWRLRGLRPRRCVFRHPTLRSTQ